MNPESIESLVLGTSSAILLAPALKKLTLAAAQGLTFLKRNKIPANPDATNVPAVHHALAEVDQLLLELKSTMHLSNTTPAAAPHPDTISQVNHQLSEMVDSIHGLVDEVRQLAGPNAATEEGGVARQAVGTVLSSIAAFGGQRRRARIFMSTGTGHFDTNGSAYTIKIAGNLGSQQLTFASGTSQTQIITATNQFIEKTGVYASQDNKTSYLVEFRSINPGGRFFVAARRLQGNLDNILYDESRSHPANLQVDFGER